MLPLKDRFYSLLRASERYTKTDMVYLTRSGFWLNLQFVVTSAGALLLSIAFANLLSKEVFGIYQYLLSISALLAAFTYSGYNTAITRSVAQGYPGTLRASIRPQLAWNLLPALAGLAVAAYYLYMGNSTLGLGALCVSFTLPLIATFNSYAAYLAGISDFKRVALYGLVGNIAYYGAMFLFIFWIPEALPLIAVNLGVTTLASILLYHHTVRKIADAAPADPDAPAYAKHLSAMNVLGTFANQVDNFIIFHILGPAQLAVYAIAKLLPERIGSVFKLMTFSAAMPRFAQREYASIRVTLLSRLGLLSVVILAVAGLYALAAPFVFTLIYPTYEAALPFSQLYALTFVSYIGGTVSAALYAHRQVRSLYVLNIGLPIVQIAFQVIGVLLGGLTGLIIGKVLALAIASAASIVLMLASKDQGSDSYA